MEDRILSSKKRSGASNALTSASSSNNRSRKSSVENHQDGSRDPGLDIAEQFRSELLALRRQQELDRSRFDLALSAHNDELENLRRALHGRRQGRTPTEDLAGEVEFDESTVKIEEDDTAEFKTHICEIF